MTEDEIVSIINSMDLSLSKFQEMVKDQEAWCATVYGVPRVRQDIATEQQQLSFRRPAASETWGPVFTEHTVTSRHFLTRERSEGPGVEEKYT